MLADWMIQQGNPLKVPFEFPSLVRLVGLIDGRDHGNRSRQRYGEQEKGSSRLGNLPMPQRSHVALSVLPTARRSTPPIVCDTAVSG